MSVLDLKAWFRAGKFVWTMLKHFPESADDHFISQIIHESARFGRIHCKRSYFPSKNLTGLEDLSGFGAGCERL